jgi:hypothetical protein
MRQRIVRFGSGVAIVASLLGLACGETTSPQTAGDYRFQSSATGSTLVVQIAVPAMRDTAETLRRSHAERWVVGAVRRGDGGVNASWSWHLDPTTIAFPEITIEACQATPEYIEQTLEYWITFGQVCISGFVTTRL